MGTILKNGINYSGSSGGGGVSSYNELTDKPSIEGVTLSGNKTASDLGLAKSTDIPSTDTCYSTGDTAETTIADDDYFPFYDTSASGKRKTLWSNIKSVLKTYFDTYYSGGSSLTAGTGIDISNDTVSVKEFASGDMTEVMTPLPSSASKYMNYSTEEQVIGTWIDGRKLYQKTIDCGKVPNTGSTTTAHNIPNIDAVISVSGWFQKNDNAHENGCFFIGIPRNLSKTDGTDEIRVAVNNTIVKLETYMNFDQSMPYRGNTYVTIKYLKTS